MVEQLIPVGAMLLAASLVILRTGILWRWLAYLGIVLAIMALLAPIGLIGASPTEEDDSVFGIGGFIAFLGFALWILVASIGMLTKQSEPAPVAEPVM